MATEALLHRVYMLYNRSECSFILLVNATEDVGGDVRKMQTKSSVLEFSSGSHGASQKSHPGTRYFVTSSPFLKAEHMDKAKKKKANVVNFLKSCHAFLSWYQLPIC